MYSPSLPATVTVRRYLAFFLALLLAATVLVIATAAPARAAYASTYIDDIHYSVDTDLPDAGATVERYYGRSEVVVIPRIVSIEGTDYTVTTIGPFALDNGMGTALRSVTLPDSIVTIGLGAFMHARLTAVTLPDSLVTLGGYAFYDNRLTSVVIPAGVTTVGAGAFVRNHDLRHVQFNGPAPSVITGTDTEAPSLGTAAGLTVTYPALHSAQPSRPGYSTPNWLGYSAFSSGYAVFFETGGGTAIDPIAARDDEVLVLPSVPVREGYTFTGWYTSPELDVLFDSEIAIPDILTLYAGWQRNSVPAVPVTPDWTSLLTGSLGSLALSGPVA